MATPHIGTVSSAAVITSAGGSPRTQSIAIGSAVPGQHRALLVWANAIQSTDAITTITAGGSPMTALGSGGVGSNTQHLPYILTDPSTDGSGNCALSISLTGDGEYTAYLWWAVVDDIALSSPYTDLTASGALTGSSATPGTGAQSIPAGSLLVAGMNHNFSSSYSLTGSGSTEHLHGSYISKPMAIASRTSTGTIAWSTSSSNIWYVSAILFSGDVAEPPAGTVTIGTITPGTTSAQVAYTYSAGDATGFAYRLGSGTWMALGPSPATIGGLSASTAYALQIRATNASGASAASAAQSFTTGAGGATVPVVFAGSVPAQSATRGVPFSLDLANHFSGTQTPFTYSLKAGSLAGTGLSLSGSVIGGTPSGSGLVSGLVVRATDAAANTASSNAFAIDIAAPAGSITTEAMVNNTGTPQANRSVHWSWLAAGRIGALASVTPVDGTGTSDGGGRLTVSGLPSGAGVLMVAVRGATVADDAVYWQPGVVA